VRNITWMVCLYKGLLQLLTSWRSDRMSRQEDTQ
jgi:hypothetical protein